MGEAKRRKQLGFTKPQVPQALKIKMTKYVHIDGSNEGLPAGAGIFIEFPEIPDLVVIAYPSVNASGKIFVSMAWMANSQPAKHIVKSIEHRYAQSLRVATAGTYKKMVEGSVRVNTDGKFTDGVIELELTT
jgi:hypothetical protein